MLTRHCGGKGCAHAVRGKRHRTQQALSTAWDCWAVWHHSTGAAVAREHSAVPCGVLRRQLRTQCVVSGTNAAAQTAQRTLSTQYGVGLLGGVASQHRRGSGAGSTVQCRVGTQAATAHAKGWSAARTRQRTAKHPVRIGIGGRCGITAPAQWTVGWRASAVEIAGGSNTLSAELGIRSAW